MSAVASGPAVPRPVRRRTFGPVRDVLAIAWRNLTTLRRVPRLLIFSTIQPLVFVFLFRYVFAGVAALSMPGIPYVDFLMPGVYVQVAVFGAMTTAIGLATDVQTGLLERFRSLPMSRSAVLPGRTLADLARNVFVVALMVGIGFAMGFRTHLGLLPFLGGVVLVLLFGFAMMWVYAVLGLVIGDPETSMAAGFPILAPLVFASAAFIPVDTMPGWLQACQEPVRVRHRVRGARMRPRRPDSHLRLAVARMVGGHHARLRSTRRMAISAERVTRFHRDPPHGVIVRNRATQCTVLRHAYPGSSVPMTAQRLFASSGKATDGLAVHASGRMVEPHVDDLFATLLPVGQR